MTTVFAQTVAVVQGTVVDKDNEPIENVRVYLLNTSFTANTNSLGEFQFYEVPYGRYVLSFQKTG